MYLDRSTFLKSIENIEDIGITSLYTLSEPANAVSRSIVDLLTEFATGMIELQKKSDVVDKQNPGIMTIIPYLGHSEGKFSANYFIEPDKGILVDYVPSPDERTSLLKIVEDDDKYKSISTRITSYNVCYTKLLRYC